MSQSETSLHFRQSRGGQEHLRSTVSWTHFKKTLFFYYTFFGLGNEQEAMEISIFRHSLSNRIRGSLPGNARITRLISIKSDFGCAPTHGKFGCATANLSCYFLAVTSTFSPRKLTRNGALPPLNHLSLKTMPLKLKIVSTTQSPAVRRMSAHVSSYFIHVYRTHTRHSGMTSQ